MTRRDESPSKFQRKEWIKKRGQGRDKCRKEDMSVQFRFYHLFVLTGSASIDSGGGGREGGRGAVREGGREKWRDWKVIIGDMLTWQGACNPKPGTQTNTGAHPSIHPHAQRERHIPNAIQQDTLYLLCPYKHKKMHTHTYTQVDWHRSKTNPKVPPMEY